MEADFGGYATKAGLLCSDGRTIMPGAFKHHDKKRIPLVWQHQHGDPINVLGHAILEDRPDGTYAYGFFNDSDSGKMAKIMVQHGDVEGLSIYANHLKHQGKNVVQGDLVELSLCLQGANPGAFIDTVSLAHSDSNADEEAIIYTGLSLELQHSSDNQEEQVLTDTEERTVKEIFDEMTDEQKEAVYVLVGDAIDSAEAEDKDDDKNDDVQHTDNSEFLAHIDSKIEEGITHMRNVFEQASSTATKDKERPVLSHSQIKTIVTDAIQLGSLKDSFLKHADEYGFGEDIDILFPDARTLSNNPELLARRTEWVSEVIDGTKHSPFSRIKSIVADITADEARAKGYVKGNLKKEEIIKLLKRVTTPTTVYKKQKLDRDDIVDITDLDIVAWLKAEMRLMLDEELARAILIGDGREPDDEDKIDEDHLRPIAFDVDMYAHKVNLASTASPEDLEEGILRARTYYKGTGQPTLFTTDEILTDLLLRKDKMNRRIYDSIEQLAAALRVKKIVVVEVMESTPDILGIVVNLTDYTIGADKGGNIAMFDDFDIDYNQYKYLIETRASGALTKPKSALVIRRAAGTTVTPTQPQYNPTTHVLTIPSVTGVIYSIDGVDKTAGNITITETTEVEARPAATYSFPHNIDADWTFIF